MWDPPPIAGVLSNLTYQLTVTNMNTGVVIINTTITETSYTVGSLTKCAFYTARVAAASLHQSGDAEFIKQRIPGGINLYSMCIPICIDIFDQLTTGQYTCHVQQLSLAVHQVLQ